MRLDAGERLLLIRLEPDAYRFAVGYTPGAPRALAAWTEATGALIVVNGGFFTPEYQSTGLIVADGQVSGTSYGAFAGMFAVDGDGPTVRSLAVQPYRPDEPLEAAVQSFPLLIRPDDPGPHPEEDGQPARRTVVAEDAEGRLLFILATEGALSLRALSEQLLASDLDLVIALNLDGGGSSGLLLADPPAGVPAFTPLPAVILVYPRADPEEQARAAGD